MYLETAIALVLIFGALVMFHELGHFIAARAVGIRVEEFAFGFGPRLLRLFKRGDTEYTIHPIPMGGFVKLAGMEPGEEDIPDGFQSQAPWKRALVIACGPIASFVLAVLAFIALGLIWGYPEENATQNRVAMVQPQSIAARIDLRAGDRIVEINGRKFSTGDYLTKYIHANPGKKLDLVIKRNGETLRKSATPGYDIQYAGIDWTFFKPSEGKVNATPPESIAEKTGIEKDDVLVSLNGQPITSGRKMLDAIRKTGDKPVEAVLRRGDKTFLAVLRPSVRVVNFKGTEWIVVSRDEVDKGAPVVYRKLDSKFEGVIEVDGRQIRSGGDLVSAIREARGPQLSFRVRTGGKTRTFVLSLTPADIAQLDSRVYEARGLLGFQPAPVLKKTGFTESIKRGIAATGRLAALILESLTPSKIKDSVGGPLLIAQQTYKMVALGPYYVVQMGGILSMSLFFVNLLPIPVLDGGHIAIILVEAIRRKRLTRRQMEYATFVGLAIIGFIVVYVMWSDISKLSQGLVPQ